MKWGLSPIKNGEMNKIKFLFKLKLCAVSLGLFLSGNILAQTDTLSFLHITDTHIISDLAFYHPGIVEGRKHYGEGNEPLKHFLQTMPEKTNCDFVAITGDLIDFFEAQTGDGKMLGFQAEQFARLIDGSPVPVFATLGNHDIAAYSWPEDKRESSQTMVERARATWSKNLECFKNGTYYSRLVEVDGKKYRLIFLDNGYNSFLPEEDIVTPYIDKPQLHWLEDQIQQSEDDTEIIFMHIPVVPANREDEPACELYSVLAKYMSPRMILAGHNHKNAIRDFSSVENMKITQVQTGAFGRSVENWRLISLTNNKILVSYPGNKDTEIEISIDE
jgi:3',5'-cyclic AMP phosphodiesterase CpdA